ncbi:MAG: alpha-L-rhamnosidase C-terminal domain-containing protein [bacterium]|nr:alpha-L-rhamnosidase C-terminal domain-containing protein [bacterium]
MKKSFVLAVVCGLSFVAWSAECVRVFRPVRLTRGDTNIRHVQDIDEAAWIWMPGHDVWGVEAECNAWNVRFGMKKASDAFFRFRNRFVSDGTPVKFDVSADERFTLYLDGKAVARGPHRGLVEHWYYQSYEIRGLEPGEHLLEAVTWQLGIHAPLAQLSHRGGFILKAEGTYDAKLTTGKGAWEVAPLANTHMTDRGTSGTFGVGSQCEVTGTGFPCEQPAADAWKKATVVRGGVKTNPYGGRTKGWMLFPSGRPDQMYDVKRPGTFKAARAGGGTNDFYAAADAASPFVKQFNAVLAGGTATVPPNTDVRLVWDLDDYYCAYPELAVSGGAGTVVTWGWAESLRNGVHVKKGRNQKGNRDVFDGKNMAQQLCDTFRCDGRADAFFTAPWWRCGRWCELRVKTAGEPLVVKRLSIGESRYPLAVDGSFGCDDPAMPSVAKVSRRAMEMCMHEMLFDCPYYEQQMYPGDTRIQLNVLNALTRDPRMARFAMSVYDYDRRDNGMVGMNFPTRGTQESATYTMCWIMMFRDYLMWHDDAAFLKARMPGVRNALMGLALYENAEGLLENLPGWSFMDWVRGAGAFAGGVAPCGSPGEGVSALNNLQYLLALQSAAAVDAALGEASLAEHWRAKADRLGKALVAGFWDEGRGALADTLKKDRFSEHAQCMAILADILAPAQRTSAFTALAKGEGLSPTSSYFAHYLFETYAKCGRADLIRDRFSYWRNYVAWGARTAFETQDQEARSDCHAWSACPLYFMQTAFAGVTPAAPFFRKVCVAPQPAGLKRIQAKTPHPNGVVETDLRFEGDKVMGSVTLPAGTAGTFVWGGREIPLVSGMNRL